jgi:hypothetical protein
MKEPELIYPLDGFDIVPVKANEVICFWKEYTTMIQDELDGKLVWMAVELENGSIFRSNRYEPSEANNLLRRLLKRNDFVIVKQDDIFLKQDCLIRISGVRFPAIRAIGKNLASLEYNSSYDDGLSMHVIHGKVVESTSENYKKWKKSQEGENGGIRDNLSVQRT